MTPTVLFETVDVRVRHVPAADASRHVVTFDCYHDVRGLDRTGFGEEFLAQRGITATHVLTRDNDWYQHPEMPDAMATVRHAAAGAAAVMTYGSSMGGYAALRFADAAGASRALALSPQYSIDPAKAPFEARFGQDQRRLRFLPGIDGPIRCAARPVVAYDTHGTDRLHADRIAADIPITRLRVPYGGHPVGGYLQDAGLLADLVLHVLAGTLDVAATGRALRRARRALGIHYGNLAAAQPACRPRLAVSLAQRAVELAPDRLAPRHALALRLSAAGRHAEALAAHEQVAAWGRHPGFLLDYSHALSRAGDAAGALAVAHEIRQAWPHHAGVHHWISDLLRAQRDLPGALHHAEQALALDPGSALYGRLVAMLQAKLRPGAPHLAARSLWLQARRALGGR